MNRQIAQGAAASLLYMTTVLVVSVVQLRLVIQMLPGNIAGVWLLFMTIGSYVIFFDLGINPTVGREISFLSVAPNLSEHERHHRINELLATVRVIFRAVALSIGLAGLIVGEIIISRHAHILGDLSLGWAWAVFSLGASLNLLGSISFAGLFGLGHVAVEKAIRALSLLVGLALTILFLKLHWGIMGLSLAWLLQSILAISLARYHLQRRSPALSGKRCSLNWQLAKKLAMPSLKLAVIQLGAILILQSANPIIAIVIGTAAIPPYEAVAKIAATMMTLALLIVNSSTPFLSMSYVAGKLDQFEMLLFRNLRLGVGLMAILSAFVAVNGDRIVYVWLGRAAFAGFPVLLVLLLMVLLEVHHVIFATAAIAAGQIVFVWPAIISGILNIAFAVFLSQRFGLLGVAVAVALAQILTNNWYAPYATMRFFKISWLKLMWEVWLPTVALIITQLALNLVIKQLSWLGAVNIGPLVLNFIISICIGIPAFWILMLRSSERARILELLLQGWSRMRIEPA